MASTSIGKKVVRIVFTYWMRTLLSSRNLSLNELAEITIKYYPFVFEWDPTRCGSGLVLSNGNKVVTMRGQDNYIYQSVYSKHIIYTDMMAGLKWEITMREKGGDGWMTIGLMDKQHIESAQLTEKAIGQQRNQMGFRISDGAIPHRFINGRTSNLVEWKNVKYVRWNIGDRVRLNFDCKGGRCSAFLNDQSLGTLTDDLPQSFYLGITVIMVGTSLETTLFEIVQH